MKTTVNSPLFESSPPTEKAILISLGLIVLFVESILILISSIRLGFLKKEVLTRKTKLGYDIDIFI